MISNRTTTFNRAGFTLVEIMIVVAIIALLAAIAVPGFLRARKRSQATAILNDAKVIDGAIAQYAVESGIRGSTGLLSVPGKMGAFAAYLKPGSRLYTFMKANPNNYPTDLLGNEYLMGTIDNPITVSAATVSNFTDVIDNTTSFWGAYSPP